MRLYGLRTGEPDPALMGTVGTVAGVLLDEDGHLVASHVAATVEDLRDDLRERAHAAIEADGGSFTWLDDDRASAPRPCPGCHRCRRDWPDLVDVDAATMPPLSAEPAGRVDVGVTPVDAPRSVEERPIGQVAYEAWCDAVPSPHRRWVELHIAERDGWAAAAAEVYALALRDAADTAAALDPLNMLRASVVARARMGRARPRRSQSGPQPPTPAEVARGIADAPRLPSWSKYLGEQPFPRVPREPEPYHSADEGG